MTEPTDADLTFDTDADLSRLIPSEDVPVAFARNVPADAEIADIRAFHRPEASLDHSRWCYGCKLPWPCDVIRLADVLARERERAERLQEDVTDLHAQVMAFEQKAFDLTAALERQGERAERAETTVGRLKGLLAECEWAGQAHDGDWVFPICPVCASDKEHGHDDDCLLAAALAGKEATE